MNENKSINSLKKQLVAAVAMVCVAAVALGSSTYAWFAANNKVTAEGMQLQAQGETGIVIKSKDNTASAWATTASAGMTAPTQLLPTSTIDLSSWYHAISDTQNDEKSHQDKANYTDVTANKNNYVLMKTFLIRSAADAVPVNNVKLAVDSIKAETTTAGSENLNKAIRIGVKIGNDFYIYAPLNNSDFTLTANYSDSAPNTLVEKKEATADLGDTFNIANNTVPANDTELSAEIYMWFEGEDPNCKSTNITASLDTLNVTVVFATVPVTA